MKFGTSEYESLGKSEAKADVKFIDNSINMLMQWTKENENEINYLQGRDSEDSLSDYSDEELREFEKSLEGSFWALRINLVGMDNLESEDFK